MRRVARRPAAPRDPSGAAHPQHSALSTTPPPAHPQLARTWGSLHAMLPVGGPKIWGNVTWAPDDVAAPNLTAAGRSLGGVIARVGIRDDDVGSAVRANETGRLSPASVEALTRTVAGWVAAVGGGGAAAAAEGGGGEEEDTGEVGGSLRRGRLEGSREQG
jgi:hypothetical protein